jgi:hypothetical protein
VHQFAHSRKQICHTPKFFVRKAMVHRTVSSVLAGDCVNRETMASQLRVVGLRATTGNRTVRVYGRHPLGMPRTAQ